MHFFVFIFGCSLFFNSLVVFSNSSLFAIIGLVLFIISISILLFALKFEFFAFIFLQVYVGAVAVLFIFIVLMLQIDLKCESFISMHYSIKEEFLGFLILKLGFFLFYLNTLLDLHSFFVIPECLDYNWFSSNIFSRTDVFFYCSMFSERILNFIIMSFSLLFVMVGSICLCKGKK